VILDDTFLARWLAQELSEEELAEFQQNADYPEYLAIVNELKTWKHPDLNLEAALKATRERLPEAARPRPLVRPRPVVRRMVLAAAAVLLLLVLAWQFILAVPKTEQTGIGETTTLVLPDQSKLQLNAASKASYRHHALAWNRKIELEGEAFFQVAAGSTFTVKTERGTIKVLGTEFDVLARKNRFEVHCFDGEVAIEMPGKETVLLKAKEIFSQDFGQARRFEDKTMRQPAWTLGRSFFRSTLLTEVFAEMQRQYGRQVSLPASSRNERFTGNFVNNDLATALEMVCKPMNLTYRIEKDRIVIFSRKD
jgi:transmembrane sensor